MLDIILGWLHIFDKANIVWHAKEQEAPPGCVKDAAIDWHGGGSPSSVGEYTCAGLFSDSCTYLMGMAPSE
jgi:hypothetical protein